MKQGEFCQVPAERNIQEIPAKRGEERREIQKVITERRVRHSKTAAGHPRGGVGEKRAEKRILIVKTGKGWYTIMLKC